MSHLIIFRHLTQNRKNILTPLLLQQQQNFSRCRVLLQQQKQADETSRGAAIQPATGSTRTELSNDVRPLGEKIKETTKTVSYTAIILAGIGVTGIMFYAIFRELFSSFSPNNVYSKTLDRVKEDPRVQDAIGAPIKGFGEESRRGRRQHVASQTFERSGVSHMRMQFYVQGIRNKATVHLEVKKTSGSLEYRYLFVQLDHYPRTTIILEDNRALDAFETETTSPSSSLALSSFGGK